MDFAEKILIEYREKADKRLVVTCRVMLGLMLLVAILNTSHVFIIDSLPMNIWVGISCIVYFLPTLYCDILKQRSIEARYIFLTILVVHAGLQFAILSYHTIIMLIFPIVLACLYNQKSYVNYTIIISIPMILISHLLSVAINVVPDEPLRTIREVMVYGALPRIIEFLAIAVICYFISERIEQLVTTLAEKNNELYEEQENLILALSQIIENKSEDTGQHVKRVSEYTQILCQSLGYTDEDSWKISLASMLHDVGKIMIPEEILEKPGKLTSEEFDIVKKHIHYGRQMLETTPGELFNISTQIAHQHHERWDGKGYMGVRGEEITSYACCVALADVFDALVSKRAYKHAWTPQEAFDEIVSQKGKQFAPDVVEAFINNYDKFIEVMKKYPDETTEA